MPIPQNNYEHLKQQLQKRHQKIVRDFEQKQIGAVSWLAAKNISLFDIYHTTTRLLTTGTLAGTMLLTSNIKPPLNTTITTAQIQGLRAQLTSNEFHQRLVEELLPFLPSKIGKIGPEQEKRICTILEKYLGFPVCFKLDGNQLNYYYAWTGLEQHLYRYPGDSLSTHDDDQDAGIAPGLGAWGYFAPSKGAMTQEDYLREKYYVAVQTLYLPDWFTNSEYLYNWYKYRKVIMVNPENGSACVAVVGDAGPANWTGKQFGGSPEIMKALDLKSGMQKGKVLLLFVNDPDNSIPLGPIIGGGKKANA